MDEDGIDQPAGGRFEGREHLFPLRVYFEDTDLSGVVYHANYLRYMERGRTEFFRTAGISRANLDDEAPTAWALRRIAVEYHRPARLDDQIAVGLEACCKGPVDLLVGKDVDVGINHKHMLHVRKAAEHRRDRIARLARDPLPDRHAKIECSPARGQ